MAAKLGELPEGVASAMYLRDGWPTVVCKAVMKDGRVGIGVFRQNPGKPFRPLGPRDADAAALNEAMDYLSDGPPDYSEIHEHAAAMAALAKQAEPEDSDDDLQASFGQKAHE